MTEKCCLHYFSECVRRTIKLRYEVSFTWPRPGTLKHSKASSLSNRGKFLHCYRAVNEISSVQDSLCMTRSQKLKLRLALLTLSDSWYLTYHYRVAVARHRLSIAMKEVYIANNEHFFDRCQT